jgi:hypothetical protein
LVILAELVSFLLLQAGRGKLFPEFQNFYILLILFVLMAALIAYAIISREK